MAPTSKSKKPLTYVLIASALALTAWAASATSVFARPVRQTLPATDPTAINTPPVTPSVTIPPVRPRVELVFALDTTGSMTGLIDGAKRKIWSIAQFVQSGQPRPEVRIGLVAYRDIGDAYVTRFYDLSDDLDQVFEHLSSFQADGGGDTPEHVSKALYDAVERTSWSKDQNTLKQVYLVGDAPPHTDYHDGFDYRVIAKHAYDKGIHINTIRCGSDPSTQTAWAQISSASAGEYASIDQSGGVKSVATPYDDQLARLNSRLVDTAIGYGSGAGMLRAKAVAAHAMPKMEAADRASFFGMGGKGVIGGRADDDLVNAVKDGHLDVAAAPAASLPVEMQAMGGAERKSYVASKTVEREHISAEINDLAKRRNAYLKEKSGPADSFDKSVESAVKKQAKAVGLAY